MQTVSINDLHNRFVLAVRSGRAGILAGAGVSMVGETNLPSGPALRDLAVRSIMASSTLAPSWKRLVLTEGWSTLLPERIFQVLYVALQDRLFPFFDVLHGASPNQLHTWLGGVTNDGVSVATTNFDDCIERAMDNPCEVIHLHGQLTEARTMAVRIQQIARGIDRQLRLRVERLWTNRTILAIGYSGYDDDIRELLAGCPDAELLWLIHSKAEVGTVRLLESLSQQLPITVAFGDIEHFMKLQGIALSGRRSSKLAPIANSAAEQWAGRLSDADRLRAAEKVLIEAEAYSLLLELMRKDHSSTVPQTDMAWVHIDVAAALQRLGRFEDADELAHSASEIFSTFGDNGMHAQALNTEAWLLIERPNPDLPRAVNLLEQARALAWRYQRQRISAQAREGVRSVLGKVENNLALTCSDDREAISHLLRAIRYKRLVGNRSSEAVSAVNLVHRYAALGNRRAENYWRSQADMLIDQTQNLYQRGWLLRGLAHVRESQGADDEAANLLVDAHAIFNSIPNAAYDAQLVIDELRRIRPGI